MFWLGIRRAVLLEEPFCRACLAAGRTTYAREVDHIVPKRAGGSDDRTNLQALCKPCHSRKTAAEVLAQP
jgi:5-methylcytosine-specific restriction protein A